MLQPCRYDHTLFPVKLWNSMQKIIIYLVLNTSQSYTCGLHCKFIQDTTIFFNLLISSITIAFKEIWIP